VGAYLFRIFLTELTLNREGLPKKAELFFFFTIDPRPNLIKVFRAQLAKLVPHITSAKDCQEDRKRIADEKKKAAHEHRERLLLEMSAINIAFSHKGLEHVGITRNHNTSQFLKQR
jgi:hypothetical protein